MQFIQSNILMVTIAVSSGLMLLWSFLSNRVRGVKEVNNAAAMQLINHKNAFILDVRDENEFKAGHIRGAKLIPLSKLNDRIGEVERYRGKPILVVCRSGNRSATASAMLTKNEFSQVYSLSGGLLAWQKADLPVEKS